MPEETTPTSEEIVPTVGAEEVPPQDPVKLELERQKKPKTELEKAQYTFQHTARRLKELGTDPLDVLGVEKPNISDDDTRPVTLAEFKQFTQRDAQKTALELADSIEDESERELMKETIRTRINPELDPQEAIRVARGYVNSVKMSQIAQETARKGTASRGAASAGAPAPVETPIELTEQEMAFMRPPFNMTQEEIIKARQG